MSLISLISLLTLSSCHLRSSLLLKELPLYSCPVSLVILLILLPCQVLLSFVNIVTPQHVSDRQSSLLRSSH